MGWHGEGWGSTWIGIVCSHRHGHRYPHAPPPRPTTTPHHTATQARAHLSSLERLLEYLTLPQEPTRLLASDPLLRPSMLRIFAREADERLWLRST